MTADDGARRSRLRAGWIVLGLMVAALTVSGGVLLAGRTNQPAAGRPTPMLGGGGSLTEKSAAASSSEALPLPVEPAPTDSTPPPGQPVSVAGVGNTRTIECTGSGISVSGVHNSVTLTGRCSRVDVSGVENTVSVDGADTIAVSGVRNRVVFHSGAPELDRSGVDNTVEPG